jgi:hypothetical protein
MPVWLLNKLNGYFFWTKKWGNKKPPQFFNTMVAPDSKPTTQLLCSNINLANNEYSTLIAWGLPPQKKTHNCQNHETRQWWRLSP